MDAKLLLVHVLSPLHAGTGQGVGVIDQPIAREKATGIPFLPGSSIKGVLRDACDETDMCTKVFGPKTDSADEFAGSVHLTDARLLLLPVRCLNGVFAWVTSPLLLRRFLRDMENTSQRWALNVPDCTDERCLTADGDGLSLQQGTTKQVILEDLPLTAETSADVAAWAAKFGKVLFPQDPNNWQKTLNTHLCVISDNTLCFLLDTATEITARIRLEDTKTVARGALWYEEALPTETVLCGLVVASTVNSTTSKDVFDTIKPLTDKTLQFGGNATVGRGLCNVHMVD